MRLQIRHDWSERARQLARLIVREPFHKRSWAELAFFLIASGLTGAATLILAAFGISGLLLSVAFFGIVFLAWGLRIARGLGRWQRMLAHRLLGVEIAEPDPFRVRPGLFGWLRAALGDRAAWRSVGYFAAKVPLTIFGGWFALSVWLEALAGLTSPLTGSRGTSTFGPVGTFVGNGGNDGPAARLASHAGALAFGLVLLLFAPWMMRLVVNVDRRLMALLLSSDAVASRVKSLEVSRSKTLDAANETLRRIERDLHDGTQAQLVAMAMRLGQAKEKLDELAADDQSTDVVVIQRLVDDAIRGAREAITDLRDLARGIHPPALDTGLDNALATLAARSAVPTTVSVSIQVRPSPTIEAIGYFCAAELLANVAQHAQAGRASVTCAQHGPWLRMVVRDNGHGGAVLNRDGSSSSGLAGLADRVAAVDGHLSIASPAGGPTTITVDLPSHV